MAANLKAILSFDGRAYEAGMKKAQTTAKKTQANIVGSLKGAVAGALSVGFIASKAKEVGEFAKLRRQCTCASESGRSIEFRK